MEYNNIFNGKFCVERLEGNLVNEGWTLFKQYYFRNFTWEFSPIWKPGQSDPGGVILVHYKSNLELLTAFSYCPQKAELFIDRTHCKSETSKNIRINERYRVEQIDPDEYWLYDLEDVVNEPKDYRFRLIIKKIK